MKKRSIWDSFNFRTKMYFFFENPAYIFCEKQNYCFAQRFVPIWIIVFSQGKKFILTAHRLRQTRRHGSRYAGQNNSKVSLRKTVYFDLRNDVLSARILVLSIFSRARKTKNTKKKLSILHIFAFSRQVFCKIELLFPV